MFLEALAAYITVHYQIAPRRIRAFIGPEDLQGVRKILPTVAKFEDFTSVSMLLAEILQGMCVCTRGVTSVSMLLAEILQGMCVCTRGVTSRLH